MNLNGFSIFGLLVAPAVFPDPVFKLSNLDLYYFRVKTLIFKLSDLAKKLNNSQTSRKLLLS